MHWMSTEKVAFVRRVEPEAQHLFAVDGLIKVALLGGELDPDNHLLLVRQILHVLLHAPQQHRPQLRLVKTTAKPSVTLKPHNSLCPRQGSRIHNAVLWSLVGHPMMSEQGCLHSTCCLQHPSRKGEFPYYNTSSSASSRQSFSG